MPSQKRYDRDEMGAILQRAAQLQKERAGEADGLTLADLERIAAESGLDPAAVREAARERAVVRPPSVNAFGGPFRLRFREEVEGPVDDKAVEHLLDVVDQELGLNGRRSRAGRDWTWYPAGTVRRLKVAVQSRDAGTTITVEEDLLGLAGVLWGGFFGGFSGATIAFSLGFGMGAFGSAVLTAGLLGVGLVGGFLATRLMAARRVRRRFSQLSGLSELLALTLGARERGAAKGAEEHEATKEPEATKDTGRVAPRQSATKSTARGGRRGRSHAAGD